MSTVALFLHGGRPDAIELGGAIAGWLAERGHRVVAAAEEHHLLGLDPVAVDEDGPEQPVDLVVSVGGDGTMLRATRRAVPADAHVLGINLGQLGYLAEIEPGSWEQALEHYFAGRHGVTERLMVAARLTPPAAGVGEEDDGGHWGSPPSALNEVVIEKQAMGRTVRLGVSIDGEFFTSYVADGVIIATPTGSTAYSLSARGPIVAPTHRALLLTAVSPHSLFDRSLVLEPSSTVEVAVLGDRAAAVAVDGEHIRVLPPGATVTVTADERPARFVSFGDQDFHRILKTKFGLNDR